MAKRKRPLDRPNPRVTIEVYPWDEALWHDARVAAVRAGVPLREWVQEAVLQRLVREGGGGGDGVPGGTPAGGR